MPKRCKPFLDGNKPLAFDCLSFFLAINGYTLEASDLTVAGWIQRLGDDLDADALATLVALHLCIAE